MAELHNQQPTTPKTSCLLLTTIIVVNNIFVSCNLKPSPPNITPNAPMSKQNGVTNEARSARYFDGSKACKYLANVIGLDLGNYVPYKNVDGYTCDGGERVIKLSCNPSSEMLCNEISYSVNGEKDGATSANYLTSVRPYILKVTRKI